MMLLLLLRRVVASKRSPAGGIVGSKGVGDSAFVYLFSCGLFRIDKLFVSVIVKVYGKAARINSAKSRW